ncbi:MAG: UvrD-helicase domain-containing protein, partial [Balneolaceae bacterium]
MTQQTHAITSLFKLPLTGRVLIGASAGTGKTYTLTNMIVRLLVEHDRKLDQILAVTFTNKATKELRDRVLRRVRECKTVVQTGKHDSDPFFIELLERISDREKALAQLEEAVRNADDLQIFTIHGFCQRVIAEESLASGLNPDVQMSGSDDLLTEAAERAWRSTMYEWSKTREGRFAIGQLQGLGKTPAKLLDALKPFFTKPYAKKVGETMEDPMGYIASLLQLRDELREIWESEKPDIVGLLENSGLSRYHQHLESRTKKMESFLFDDTYQTEAPDQIAYFSAAYVNNPDNATQKGEPAPPHRFFDRIDLLLERLETLPSYRMTLVRDMIESISKLRTTLRDERAVLSFNDQLELLAEALQDGERGKALAAKLRQRYPCALVDEFQDTDPIQFSIFDTIYPTQEKGTLLMMIGDPKQAIYGFRGADLNTYLNVAEQVPARYTITENFRSRPSYNEAVNTIFSFQDHPFLEQRIPFDPIDTGKPELEEAFTTADGSAPPGMTIAYTSGVGPKGTIRSEMAHYLANDVRLLLSGEEDLWIGQPGQDGRRRVEAGDIAILVSTNKSVERCKQALRKAGIGAVTYTRSSVFKTLEADRLYQWLRGVLHHTDRRAVNNAALSGFFGFDLHERWLARQHESGGDSAGEQLQNALQRWQKAGFYAMYRMWMVEQNGYHHFAGLHDAERSITNLDHLAATCAEHEAEEGVTPPALLRWFERKMVEEESADSDYLLLESDRKLVKILTIHNSKGLQFPVVYCPDLWDGKKIRSNSFVEYHQEGTPCIHLDRKPPAEARRHAQLERVAESARHAYVALTRAQYQCRIYWQSAKESALSGLLPALIGDRRARALIEEGGSIDSEDVKEINLDEADIAAAFQKIVQQSEGAVEMQVDQPVPEDSVEELDRSEEASETLLNLTAFSRKSRFTLYYPIESFSSISRSGANPENPDYDGILSADKTESTDAETGPKHTIFTFPKGKTAGTAIHKLFEHPDFEFAAASETDHEKLIESVLEAYGFGREWTPVLQTMLREVSASTAGTLDLRRVKREDEIRELEFYFPSEAITLDELAAL